VFAPVTTKCGLAPDPSQFRSLLPSTMQEAKISVSSLESQDFPLLVSFPLGVPAHHEEMSLTVARKQVGKSTRTAISSAFHDVTYKGSDYGEYTAKKDTCKYAVGVYDEKTKKLKLIKTDHVYVMKPHIESKTVVPRVSEMGYDQRRQSLTEEFGSRKKKRALAAEKSNTILTENIAGASSMQNILSPTPKSTVAAESTAGKSTSKRPRK
jgi:hypothetical protein